MANTISISDKTVGNLAADSDKARRGTDTFFWDERLPGFGVKIGPKGGKSFIFQYRVSQGEGLPTATRRMGLGACGSITASAAREQAKKAQTRVRNGDDPVRAKKAVQTSPTVAELAQEWLQELQGRRKRDEIGEATIKEYESKLRVHILPALGKYKLAVLEAAKIEGLRTAMRNNDASEELIKGTLRVASALFSFGVQRGSLLTNPAARMRQFKSRERQRYINEAEAAQLGRALEAARADAPHWAAAAELLLVTGMRRGEVLGLRWSQIIDGQIILTQHKTSRQTGDKRLPLTSTAEEILKTCKLWQKSGCDFVFPSVAHRNIASVRGKRPVVLNHDQPMSPGGFKRFWKRLCNAAGLNGEAALRIHDLRHSFAAAAVSAGESLTVLSRTLGHRDKSTTARYAHVSDGAAAMAAEANARRIKQRLQANLGRGSVTRLRG